MFCALTGWAQTSIQVVDISTPHTNTTSGGAIITVIGQFTNATYTVTNPANVYYGDPIATAFGYVNNNFTFVENQLSTNIFFLNYLSNRFGLLTITNGGTNYTLGGTFIGNGQKLIINGTNVVSATLNSNALDTASMAWLGTAFNVVPDTAGNGGTTIHVKAQDNGADMYIHVTSLGVMTATGSP